jgi:hypothetical protein
MSLEIALSFGARIGACRSLGVVGCIVIVKAIALSKKAALWNLSALPTW